MISTAQRHSHAPDLVAAQNPVVGTPGPATPPEGGTPSPQSIARPDSTAIPRAGAARKARVLVVEDHPFVREGVVRLLNRQADLVCCGEAESIAATPLLVAEQKPDLLLLDLQLKDGEAFELIACLRAHFPAMPILVLSQCEESVYADRVLRAGAQGYLMKQEAAGELLGAVRKVLGGEIYLSRAMSERAGPVLPDHDDAARRPETDSGAET